MGGIRPAGPCCATLWVNAEGSASVTKRIAAAVVLLVLAGVGIFLLTRSFADTCQVCGRPLHARMLYRIHLADGTTEQVCCARCGLHFQRLHDDVRSAEVADFATGDMMSVDEAYFVEGSSVHPCASEELMRHDRSGAQYKLDWDRCLPSLVAFGRLEQAEAFRDRNGGEIRSYAELLQED
jgi:hypothetical protein